MGEELSQQQIRRQDFVDNAIYQLVSILNPTEQQLAWDIEMIAGIREVIRHWLVERANLTDEMSFYPYIEE